MTCHNLCTFLKPPAGFASLLGLGLKFCIQQKKPPKSLAPCVQKLARSLQIQALYGANATSSDYIPSLYIKSKNVLEYPPGNIFHHLHDFTASLSDLLANNTRSGSRLTFNLSKPQYNCMLNVKNDPRFIVCTTDKNLGPAIIERPVYIEHCLKHLNQKDTYTQLTELEATQKISQARRLLESLREFHQLSLSKAERTYFSRSLQEKVRIPLFYITFKVHKQPTSTRPIVSCIGSVLNVYSKWLDYKMKLLVTNVPTYLKDSNQALQDFKLLGTLPPHAKLFTSDAISMYTNIDSKEGISAISSWIQDFSEELPPDFPNTFFLEVLKMVMENNVFQLDDTFWIQTLGTAMGTSCACAYATLFWGYMERKFLIPKWNDKLLYFKRFIDDKFGVWIGSPAEFQLFTQDFNSLAKLQWITSSLSEEVNFLDLTIFIGPDRKLHTKTFQKPINLHLYIPPSSAHPPGVLKSIIFGNLRRYWQQNTNSDDYTSIASQFADRLVARGYSREVLTPLFLEASSNFEKVKLETAETKNLYLHWTWHPKDIPSSSFHSAYKQHLAGHDGFDRLIVAYSRPKNLRDCVTSTKLETREGLKVSDYLSAQVQKEQSQQQPRTKPA